MNFKILKRAKKTKARIGKLETKSGGIKTHVFLPIGTYGAVKNLSPEELKEVGAQIILSNTYHLGLRPGIDVVKKSALFCQGFKGQGGLHKFMNWHGPILTDSGGFQVFSLAKHRKLVEEGVHFTDPLNGRKHFLTPEKSIQIQLDLGSDIIFVLDDCPPHPCSREEVKKSMEMSLRWAQRCKKYFDKKITPPQPSPYIKPASPVIAPQLRRGGRRDGLKPLLFGIVQGSVYKDLRQESAKRIAEMGFDGFAIGGVSVGEPRKYVRKVLDWVMPLLPENKLKHLLGVGKPEEIIRAIGYGVDMFDCVIPTREARHGKLYKFKSQSAGRKTTTKNLKIFYEAINIMNEKFRKDFKPIDKNCGCYACQNYSRAYLNHLFKMRELFGYRLATIHNLYFYFQSVKVVSEQIKKNGQISISK